MRLRNKWVRPAGRASAGRRLGIFLATASILAISLTSGAIVAAPANAATVAAPAKAAIIYDTIVSAHSAQCLTSGGKDDTVATQYPCNGSSSQEWRLQGSCRGNTLFCQVINKKTKQCLGIAGGSSKAGAKVVVWRCNGHNNQYWQWQYSVVQPNYFLDNLHSGLYLTLKCGCDRHSAPMTQEPQDVMASVSQLWYV
jgi:hypothetical protein